HRKTAIKTLYNHPSDMEPLLPGEGEGKASGLVLALIRGAERLRGALHPITRKLVMGLVRSMNSYYSNLIEGHRTRPRDIDAAIAKDFSAEAGQRALQIEQVTQIEVKNEIEEMMHSTPGTKVCWYVLHTWICERSHCMLS